MKFFHRMREGRVVLQPSVFEFVKVSGQDGLKQVPKWGKTISFNAIMVDGGYRYKGKTWRGEQTVEGKEAALLMSHPNYGKDFIAFSDDGGEAELIDSFFEKQSNGSVYCWLTDRSFVNAQGAAGHKESAQFKEAVESYLNEVRTNFSA